MRELLLPKFNNNDEGCVLVGWTVDDGAEVSADAVVAEVETAKALEELVADIDGVLHRLVEAGSHCEFGRPVGLLFDSVEERDDYLASPAAAGLAAAPGGPDEGEDSEGGPAPVLSDAARTLAEEHGIGAGQLRALGKRMVKASDVQRLIDQGATDQEPAPDAAGPAEETQETQEAEASEDAEVVSLSPRQRAVAAVVSEAHRTIPAAFAAIAVDLSAFRATRGGDAPYGLVELLVKAIAARHADFPLFFATPGGGHTLTLAPAPNVGVTIDVGTGLFIPVLKDADLRAIDELTDDLMDFRVSALRQNFREDAFADEAITLSLHNDPDIVLAAPIVHPGRTCVVTLCAERSEVALAEDGVPFTRPVTTVAVTYDHRYLNGRDAVRFLTEVKRDLESADSIARLAG
ncbi:2-oxo acid dehydrogenase subunit E2 [Streptomyces sp. NBC_00083]|uniref:2-oxo acid dehydrogenase subunit E2 n=1 Tax=Streptomyces sp. NBC_00083 TaxID=2975647 RepID=UPI0022534EAD|nr:2-oxo acid dehydrogenase subunit E2 [Streptomyces sp. NBC_00083]MCX5386214.1 2-oxo acid dehydrogenase subunit E2 [Streptomyces sp. NBC_00083]